MKILHSTQVLIGLYLLTACGSGTNSNLFLAHTNFYNGQAAGSVIGQRDFVSSSTSASASTLSQPLGLDLTPNGELRISDLGYARVLVYGSIPDKNSAATPANYVLGQSSFTSSVSSTAANGLSFPIGIRSGSGKFAIADAGGKRVLIYNSYPKAGNPNADVAVGAVNTSAMGGGTCSLNSMAGPAGVAIVGTKLLIADSAGKRVLIYSSIPTSSGVSADLVLGETSLSVCSGGVTASLMSGPQDVWSDGTRVVVADLNRVLIWNTFPTFNGQPADLVLGQPNMNIATQNNGGLSAQSLYLPTGISSDGSKLAVVDSMNHRVLIWNQFPTINQQAADVVLGQSDFFSRVSATSASGLHQPNSVAMDSGHILVSDSVNNRVMIWYVQ